MDIVSIFFKMKVRCGFSLESPHRGDSNDYTQHTIINMKRKSTKLSHNTIMYAAVFQLRKFQS